MQCCGAQAQVQWGKLALGSTEIVAGLILEKWLLNDMNNIQDPRELYKNIGHVKQSLPWVAAFAGGGLINDGLYNVCRAFKHDDNSKNGETSNLTTLASELKK